MDCLDNVKIRSLTPKDMRNLKRALQFLLGPHFIELGTRVKNGETEFYVQYLIKENSDTTSKAVTKLIVEYVKRYMREEEAIKKEDVEAGISIPSS